MHDRKLNVVGGFAAVLLLGLIAWQSRVLLHHRELQERIEKALGDATSPALDRLATWNALAADAQAPGQRRRIEVERRQAVLAALRQSARLIVDALPPRPLPALDAEMVGVAGDRFEARLVLDAEPRLAAALRSSAGAEPVAFEMPPGGETIDWPLIVSCIAGPELSLPFHLRFARDREAPKVILFDDQSSTYTDFSAALVIRPERHLRLRVSDATALGAVDCRIDGRSVPAEASGSSLLRTFDLGELLAESSSHRLEVEAEDAAGNRADRITVELVRFEKPAATVGAVLLEGRKIRLGETFWIRAGSEPLTFMLGDLRGLEADESIVASLVGRTVTAEIGADRRDCRFELPHPGAAGGRAETVLLQLKRGERLVPLGDFRLITDQRAPAVVVIGPDGEPRPVPPIVVEPGTYLLRVEDDIALDTSTLRADESSSDFHTEAWEPEVPADRSPIRVAKKRFVPAAPGSLLVVATDRAGNSVTLPIDFKSPEVPVAPTSDEPYELILRAGDAVLAADGGDLLFRRKPRLELVVRPPAGRAIVIAADVEITPAEAVVEGPHELPDGGLSWTLAPTSDLTVVTGGRTRRHWAIALIEGDFCIDSLAGTIIKPEVATSVALPCSFTFKGPAAPAGSISAALIRDGEPERILQVEGQGGTIPDDAAIATGAWKLVLRLQVQGEILEIASTPVTIVRAG